MKKKSDIFEEKSDIYKRESDIYERKFNYFVEASEVSKVLFVYELFNLQYCKDSKIFIDNFNEFIIFIFFSV